MKNKNVTPPYIEEQNKENMRKIKEEINKRFNKKENKYIYESKINNN